jgi:hypothetical protein
MRARVEQRLHGNGWCRHGDSPNPVEPLQDWNHGLHRGTGMDALHVEWRRT